MRIISYTGVTKPSFLLVHPELPALAWKLQLTSILPQIPRTREKLVGLITRCQHSDAGRTKATRYADSSVSSTKSSRLGQRQRGPSSLYSRPSLLDMRNDKVANRARVYDFLRGIGIVPDELDGLELPVTVEVMRERVDFLHSLGLTVEDINNYPLVLGCSVKKNMIPVLDYLGKLGVRKSTFTDFLRRYPQVLHASVVVDLAPVVQYLQGMDIKPDDIPRVLERYPELMGFKLEGTMSTSVAYLVGIGVARREIGGVLTRYPEILGMRVGRVIKPFVEYLENLEKNQYPEIIGIDLKPKLVSQQSSLKSVIDLGPEDFGRVVEKMPQVVSLSDKPMMKHVDFLKNCGFSLEQMRKMVTGCPQLLALNLDIMKLSFDFFQKEMQRPLDDLVAFPAFFTYGLESTIKPRHKMVTRKGLKCSLGWLLNCSDEKFEQRMDYDTIEMDEMESSPSFDMNTLTEPRSDESGSDYDSDDEYA
ncbi:hypothetical protein ACLB2K_014180 [Fragaria x ananassa]